MESVRIDKWLWTVRLFKTRSMATDACNAGKVKMNGTNVKPSKNIKADEVFEVHIGQLGAPLVPQYCEDLTPPEEYERVRMLNMRFERRERGEGRPTKRDRRQIDYIKNLYGEEE